MHVKERHWWLLVFNGLGLLMVVSSALSYNGWGLPRNPESYEIGVVIFVLLAFVNLSLLLWPLLRATVRLLQACWDELVCPAARLMLGLIQKTFRLMIQPNFVQIGLNLLLAFQLTIWAVSPDPAESRLGLALLLLMAATIAFIVLRRDWPRSEAQIQDEIDRWSREFWADSSDCAEPLGPWPDKQRKRSTKPGGVTMKSVLGGTVVLIVACVLGMMWIFSPGADNQIAGIVLLMFGLLLAVILVAGLVPQRFVGSLIGALLFLVYVVVVWGPFAAAAWWGLPFTTLMAAAYVAIAHVALAAMVVIAWRLGLRFQMRDEAAPYGFGFVRSP